MRGWRNGCGHTRRPSGALAAALVALWAALLALGGRADGAFGAEAYRLLPLRIHLLRSARIPELNCRLTEADARRILGKINGIWRQAGIQFYLEALHVEEAAGQEFYHGLGENRNEAHLRLVRPAACLSGRAFHLYYIGEMRPNGICLQRSAQLLFVKETARLRKVPGGIDEDLPRVSAHEIGHALDLDHRQDETNLMASGTTGTSLNAAEIAAARAAAERFDACLRPAAALALADRLAREKREAAAAELYRVLAGLPDGEVARAAREKVRDAGTAGEAASSP